MSAVLDELLSQVGSEVREEAPTIGVTIRLPVDVADCAGRAALRMNRQTRASLIRDWAILGMEQFQQALGPERWRRLVGSVGEASEAMQIDARQREEEAAFEEHLQQMDEARQAWEAAP